MADNPLLEPIVEEGEVCGQALRSIGAISYFISKDGYDALVFSQDPTEALKKNSFDALRDKFPVYGGEKLLKEFIALFFFAQTKNAERRIRTLPAAKQKAAYTPGRKMLALVKEGKVSVGDIAFQNSLLGCIQYLCYTEEKGSGADTPEPPRFEFSELEKNTVISAAVAMFAGRTVNIGKDLTEAKAKEILRLLKGADPQKIIAVYNLAMAK